MTNLTHKATQILANDLYATQATGVKLEDIRQDYAQCTLQLQPHHRNAVNNVMGGVIYTLADFAFAAAANSPCIEAEQPLAWVTVSSTIHYLAQPTGNKLTAETQCIKRGKTSCLFHINIYDRQQNPVALVITAGRKTAPQNN